MSIIETKNIVKSFRKSKFDWNNLRFENKDKIAVDNLNLTIEAGEFVGFLGPNGAGKTTFLKILSGIIYPTSGEAKILGYTPWDRDHDYLRKIAIVMGQKNQLWWDLPAIDSYNLLKEIYSVPTKKFKKNLDNMVEILDMKQLLVKRLREMSLGERMKCELAASFLHDPEVIFLDEPTIGLDVVSSQSIRKFLTMTNKEKKCTIVLTSHYMGDIEALCKRVIIINQGKKVYDGNLSELKNQYAPERIIEIYLDGIEDRKKFAHLKMDKKIMEGKGVIRVQKKDIGQTIKEVFDKFDPVNISIAEPDTEEVISKIFSKKN